MRLDRAGLLGLWLLVAAACGGALAVVLTSDHSDLDSSMALSLFAGWSFALSGCVAWWRRPHNAIGPLMVAVGLLWLGGSLAAADDTIPFTVGLAVSVLPWAVFGQILLAYPSGKLTGWFPRLVIVVAYVDTTLVQIAHLFFLEPDREAVGSPENALLLSRNDTVADAINTGQRLVGIVALIAFVGILVQRWRTASLPFRRVLAPVFLTGGVTGVLFLIQLVLAEVSESLADGFTWAVLASLASVPLAFLAGVVRARLAQSALRELMVELGSTPPPGELRDALRRALRDPSLRVAYWLPESGTYVGVQGRPIELPAEGERQVATLVEHDGRRIGALIHDASLREHPELVEGACAAAGLALVNERLQAELRARLEELGASEERLRAIIEDAPLPILELDLEGNARLWNPAAEELFGWTAAELAGKPIPFVPLDREEEVADMRSRIRSGEALVSLETVRRRKDGEELDIALSAAPVRDRLGTPVGIMAVLADITERKRAEAELRRMEAKNRALLEAIPDLMFVFDHEGRYVDYKAERDVLLLPPSEFLGRTVEEVLPPELAGQYRERLDRALTTGEVQQYEYELTLATGTRNFEARLVASHGGEVLALIRDITDRKRAEEQLRESEARFRAIANSAPVMIWIADPDGSVTFVNQRWLEFTGRSFEDQLGFGWERTVHPDDRDQGVELWLAAARSGEAYEQEYRVRRADGQYRWVLDRATPRLHPDGSHAGYLGITVDITERKEWEQELRASRARIVEVGDAERRRLERNLHDGAQQRLVSLSLSLRLAQAQVRSSPDEAELVLKTASEELAQALQELRELARGIHPAVLTDRGLEAAIEALATRAPLPVEVEMSLDEPLPDPVEAAAYYIVSEAIANTTKYARANEVRISVARSNGRVCVEVADDGVGGAEASKGSGLRGLADRVEALEGKLQVESPPGCGTTIRAEIPL